MLKTSEHNIFRDMPQIFWRTIKLKVLMLYKFICAIPALIHYMWNPFRQRRKILQCLWSWVFNSRSFWNPKIFLCREQITIHYKNRYTTISNALHYFIIFTWLCEKMKINIKIKHPCNVLWRHFENDTIINTTRQQGNSFGKQEEYYHWNRELALLGILFNSSKYGYKILSKLSIKEELKHSADQWFKQHIKGNWVATHYRGTDLNKVVLKRRYIIDLDPYITYLKEVLDDQCNIFACSDQAQFIDKMREAFPGRVTTRDIYRSHNSISIHSGGHYHQEKDALIDILVLAKSKLIFTNGSSFIDIVRYFNPKVKIVTLNRQGRGRISGNVLPIPQKELFNKLRIKH